MVIEPGTSPVKVNVPTSPAVAFLMTMPPFFTLKKVQVTVSLAETTMAPTDEPSSHVEVVSHPSTGVSATEYVPGLTELVSWPPEAEPSVVVVVIEPLTAPVKLNVPVVPVVAFLTTMLPRLTLLNVQVTVSPADSATALMGEPSSQLAVVSQPATGVSATE